jgi:hypothetical protein
MLAPSVQHSYTLGMRKYLDIPLTVVVSIVLTTAMLWPLEAARHAPEGSVKLVHFMAFAASLPIGPHQKYVVHYSKEEAVFGTANFDLKSILSVNKVA